MTYRVFRVLSDPVIAHRVMVDTWAKLKPYLVDGQRFELVVRPETRTLSQSAKFHVLCEEAELAELEWGGKPRTAAEWKVLFISGHATATKEGAELIQGLEGELVNIRESSAQMTKPRTSSLIEYTQAYLIGRGIQLHAPEPSQP